MRRLLRTTLVARGKTQHKIHMVGVSRVGSLIGKYHRLEELYWVLFLWTGGVYRLATAQSNTSHFLILRYR